MISIVVPTMWRYLPMLDFVGYLTRSEVVEEVIIIDNDNTRTPIHPTLTNPKVKKLDYGRNIFVNPAFNEGVKNSRSDIICFLNDDMLFDMRALYKVNDFMKPDTGVIGVSKGDVSQGHIAITTGEIVFDPFRGQNCWGFGEVMFVHRAHWIDIPEGLDLGFGDNFIFERYHFAGFQNYFLANMFHHHVGSITVNETPQLEKQAIYEREKVIYNSIRSQMLDGSFFKNSKRV